MKEPCSEGEVSGKKIYAYGIFTDPQWLSGNRYVYNVNCIMLPHVEFNITYENGDKGPVIDEWKFVDEDKDGIEDIITLPYN